RLVVGFVGRVGSVHADQDFVLIVREILAREAFQAPGEFGGAAEGRDDHADLHFPGDNSVLAVWTLSGAMRLGYNDRPSTAPVWRSTHGGMRPIYINVPQAFAQVGLT